MIKKAQAARKKVTGQRARKPEEKALVRDQILKNAIDLYGETGYQGFSMRKLALRAGFSPAALYRYFDDKDMVFSGLVDLGFKRMEKKLQVVKGKDLKSYLMAFARAYFEFALTEQELYKLMTTEHPPSSVMLDSSTKERRWEVFSSLGDQVELYGLPMLKSTVENSAATDAIWAFGHGLASLAISLPYFNEERMDKTLQFVFAQVEPFIDQFSQECQS